jgi:hypothetical protein
MSDTRDYNEHVSVSQIVQFPLFRIWFTIVRYLPDGGLDTAFGGSNTGYIQVDFEGMTSPLQRANAVAIQDDGKIVVAGYWRDNTADPSCRSGSKRM